MDHVETIMAYDALVKKFREERLARDILAALGFDVYEV